MAPTSVVDAVSVDGFQLSTILHPPFAFRMDAAAQKLLESATHRTLHAQNFSRSSTQASLVLTDLLGRYLTLLTSTCTKYAQHAGRTKLTTHDLMSSLDELGLSQEELEQYCGSEGRDLERYTEYSTRRTEDLAEFQG